MFATVMVLCVSCGKQGPDSAGAADYAFVFDVRYVGGSELYDEMKAMARLESLKVSLNNLTSLVNKNRVVGESQEESMKSTGQNTAILLSDMKCFEGKIVLKKGSETLDSWDVGPR